MRDLFDSDFPEIYIDKPIRLIELFGGYGSQAMALERIGADFEHHFLCEFDEPAVRSYNAVHGTDFKPLDIRDVHGEDLKICDTDRYCYLLTYSFPCTDLSVAGKMAGMAKGSGTRSGLLWEVERILRELHGSGAGLPQCLFMENVPQVTGKRNADDFDSWRAFLRELGYTSYLEILNAKDYDVAQNRKRAFMLSFLGGGYYEFPKPIPLEKRLVDYLEEEVDEKYYLKKEKEKRLVDSLVECGELGTVGRKDNLIPCRLNGVGGGKFLSMRERTVRDIGCETAGAITASYHKGAISHGDNMVIEMERSDKYKKVLMPAIINKIDRTMDKLLPAQEATLKEAGYGVAHTITTRPEGVKTTILPVVKGEVVQGGLQKHQHPRKDGISPSITAACGMGGGQTPIFTERRGAQCRIRRLTPRECGRLMGVKDSDIDKMAAVNSNSQLYKQFGNSIVIDVMCAMFRKLNIRKKKGEQP